jgi:uncharacterized protein YbjT (DUF2867 family)
MPESLLPPKTILLLGATGKVGQAVRAALQQRAPGSKVLCLSRKPFDGKSYPGEEWRTFDPLQSEWKISEKIDVLINAVGAIHETKAMPFAQVHTGLTRLLLHHRATLGQPRIVQVSALGANAEHAVPFLRTKGEADALLLAEQNTVVLRPSIICTPNTLLAQKMRTLLTMAKFAFGKLLVPTGFPATQIQPVMGEDVGHAIAAASWDDQSGVLDIVGPTRYAFGDLLRTMAEAQGRKIRLVEVSRDIMETFVKHFVGVWFPDAINYDQFRLLFQDNVGDLAATQAILGRMPASTEGFWKAEAVSQE